jgi:hypothetical protein
VVRAEVGAGDPGLLGDGVLAVVRGDRLDGEVGDAGEVRAVVAAYGLLAVEDLARRDDLVARMVEGRDDRVQVVGGLGGGVRVEDGLASAPQVDVA